MNIINYGILLLALCIVAYFLLNIRIYIAVYYHRTSNCNDDYIAISVFIWKDTVKYELKIPIVKFIQEGFLDWVVTVVKTNDSDPSLSRDKQQTSNENKRDVSLNSPYKILRWLEVLGDYARLYHRLMKKIIPKLKCELFLWNTIYGLEYPTLTGVMIGIIWSVKNIWLARLHNKILFMQVPHLSVTPRFQIAQFETELQCIFSIKLGNVVNACFSLIKQ